MRDGAARGREVLFHVRAARHRRGSGGRRTRARPGAWSWPRIWAWA